MSPGACPLSVLAGAVRVPHFRKSEAVSQCFPGHGVGRVPPCPGCTSYTGTRGRVPQSAKKRCHSCLDFERVRDGTPAEPCRRGRAKSSVDNWHNP